MSEQRLVTLHGGPLDGQNEAWAPWQASRRVYELRFSDFIGTYQVPVGDYRGDADSGDAVWEPVSEKPKPPPPPRPWWKFW